MTKEEKLRTLLERKIKAIGRQLRDGKNTPDRDLYEYGKKMAFEYVRMVIDDELMLDVMLKLSEGKEE